jgi:hypothetical protein
MEAPRLTLVRRAEERDFDFRDRAYRQRYFNSTA